MADLERMLRAMESYRKSKPTEVKPRKERPSLPLTDKQKVVYERYKNKMHRGWARQRYAYVLHSKYGLKYREIGEKLGVTGGQAQVLAKKGEELQRKHPHLPAQSDVYVDFKKHYDDAMSEKYLLDTPMASK